MGRTRLSAGRMPREPVVSKPSPIIKSPPSTTDVVETTPPSSRPSATNVTEPTPTFPSQSPSFRPSNPDTKNKANKPRPKPQHVFHRRNTRSLNKVVTPENPLPVNDPSSSDDPGSEEVVSVENNSDSSKLDSSEPENSPQTQEKQPKPPAVQSPVTDQRKSSRRRAAPQDLVFPPPKRTKAQVALRAHSLPLAAHNRPRSGKAAENNNETKQHVIVLLSQPQHEKKDERNKKTNQNIVPFSMSNPQAQHEKATGNSKKTIVPPSSRPQREKAAGNKKTKQNIVTSSSRPRREKAKGNEKKTKQHVIDEIIEDVGPFHTSDDIASLHVKIDLLTKMVLENKTMLKDQQVQLNHLETMVKPILDRDV